MRVISFAVYLATVLLLVACESEKQQYQRLTAEYKGLGEKLDLLRSDIERLKQEQEKNWRRNAKERFAYLYDISKYAGKSLDYEKNIESVQFQKTGKRSYLAMVKIRPEERAIKPNFVIHLYSRKGVIIGSAYKLKNFWAILKRKIPKGTLQVIKCEIELLEDATPCYFRVDHPND